MATHKNEIGKVGEKLRSIRGDAKKNVEIPFIETMCDTYKGDNVLEGFRADTEILCNQSEKDNDLYDDEFYQMCIIDNEII